MLAQRLVNLRNKHKYTQQKMAEYLGVTRPAYTAYERGSRKPDYDTLQKIADLYDVSVDYLLGRTDKPRLKETTASKQSENDFNALEEIRKLCDEYGIEDFGFFDISKWREMTPDDVEEIRKHFEYIMFQVNKRKDEEK
ncbi:helix-turn-helix transcriptional regulator [Bacillus tianshenii]|nr:helix-turn-helix transcriptional regulator [Bacillus tianshenii]